MAQKYFKLGTIESRIKGGKISQQRRRENPEKYRQLGCKIRKNFIRPPYSTYFAELIGIILGDGTISNYQVRVTLDRHRDKEYADFVKNLMVSILGEAPAFAIREYDNTISLTLSGVGLVEMLEEVGMERGDKIAHQISFPLWIRNNSAYSIACVRGLFDTDGGLYFHQKGEKKYLGWCFCSHSEPLLADVYKTLRSLDFNVKNAGGCKLCMYRLSSIERYLSLVGSSNPKNEARLKLYREQE
jgi:hypothetical protein